MFVIQMIVKTPKGAIKESWVEAVVHGNFEKAVDVAVNNTVLKYFPIETLAYNEKEEFAVYQTTEPNPAGGYYTEVDVYTPRKTF